MRRRTEYSTSPQPNPYPRISGSSAFSDNALPDEDWTQITDLTERRRIQNRIAQRNYRKKLKQRMENLDKEERDGSGGARVSSRPSSETPPSQDRVAAGKSQHSLHMLDMTSKELAARNQENEMYSYDYQQPYLSSSTPEMPSSTLPYSESYGYAQYPAQPSYYSATTAYEPLLLSQGHIHNTTASHQIEAVGNRVFMADVGNFLESNNTNYTEMGIQATLPVHQQLQSPMSEPYCYGYYDPNGYSDPDPFKQYNQRNYHQG
ncbi:predicted protein [Uncinocarpus reesii 1704]|uniref:BZIP domain-containing protein n=1 Tax=Uncinocarpus reesii (strain UAMH 1704) TaxID=336963 RepID=C4JT42_UNCRE|nr:uncharacterized protein UREG_05631 [Uncinocarpus reesii 1704]EEP80789.1 predicted protein [Uncinocarpus reesii 1704]